MTLQLERGPALIAGILASAPPPDLKRRPQADKWSAHEHACHVAVMEPRWAARLDRMLQEDNPAIVSYEPADEAPDRLLVMDLRAMMGAYEDARMQLVMRLRER